MSSRFTERVQRALVLAQEEAQRLSHDEVGTGHVLAGLVAMLEGVGMHALLVCGFDTSEVRRELQRIPGDGQRRTLGDIPLADDAKALLMRAVEVAYQFGHTYVGTEHVVIAMMHIEGRGKQIIEKQGLTEHAIRDAVHGVLSGDYQ